MLEKGVFIARKKDGTIYYRSSITYHGKHISLGSYKTESEAAASYLEADKILNNSKVNITDFNKESGTISFNKWVSLINFRDNNIYFKNPIYIYKNFFEYHFDTNTSFKFDVDDLFFYSHHKIMKRGNHLFVAYYGMQINILSRYGIHNHSVPGRDYIFVNGDNLDLRYKNIKIINRYKGVIKEIIDGRDVYTTRIHLDNDYIVGRYHTEEEAAIAYNKAADIICAQDYPYTYETNYIDNFSSIQYASTYNSVKISKKLIGLKTGNT